MVSASTTASRSASATAPGDPCGSSGTLPLRSAQAPPPGGSGRYRQFCRCQCCADSASLNQVNLLKLSKDYSTILTMKRSISLLAVLTVVGATVATAQINYSGGTYSENFNTIFNVDGTGTAVPGTTAIGLQGAIPTLTTWQAARVGGSGATTFAIFGDWGGSGASTAGRLYSYGLPASTRTGLGRRCIRHHHGWLRHLVHQYFIGYVSALLRSVLTVKSGEHRTQRLTKVSHSPMAWRPAELEPGIFITSGLMTAYPALNATSPSSFAALNGGSRRL